MRRVVVTGLGIVSSIGNNAQEVLASLRRLAITGVIPFGETIFLWQSMLIALILSAVSTWVARDVRPTSHTSECWPWRLSKTGRSGQSGSVMNYRAAT